MTRALLGAAAALLLHGLFTIARLEPIRTPRPAEPAVVPVAMELTATGDRLTVTRFQPRPRPTVARRYERDALPRAVAYGSPTVALALTALLGAWALRAPRPRDDEDPEASPSPVEPHYRLARLDLPSAPAPAARRFRVVALLGWGLAMHAFPAVTASLHLAR